MMETIAITNWNTIVSPVYDAACCLMIVYPDHIRGNFNIKELSAGQKAALCSGQGVKVLICGAISTIGCALLQEKNIRVISWIRGPIEDIISAYRKDEDLKTRFSMPGCGSGLCKKSRSRIRHQGGCFGIR